MARRMKRKRQLLNDPLTHQISYKKTKFAGLSKAVEKVRADHSWQYQAPCEFPRSNSENQEKQAGDHSEVSIRPKQRQSSGTVHKNWNFPPEFYDKLSKVWLTPLALRELDRRNNQNPPRRPLVSKIGARNFTSDLKKGGRELARFARTGGPDLCDLRGYQEPTSAEHAMASAPISSSTSRQPGSTKQKRSTAYDGNFRQHCKDCNIFPPHYRFPDGRQSPMPANLDAIQQAVKVPRGPFSPSDASRAAFEDFRIKNEIESEGTVMRTVIPLITGDLDIPNEGNLPFANLASITEGRTVNPYPDFFDGAHPEAVNREVRIALDKIIIPTKKPMAPIAPNLFMEVKSSSGRLDVVVGQVILDGAHGTIIMHALQNHLLDEPVYDGNAYTFSAIFLSGVLRLYAHHPTAPAEPGQNPGCHITQIDAYELTGNYENWLEGKRAFRNLRKLAKKYRDEFIETANGRARG